MIVQDRQMVSLGFEYVSNIQGTVVGLPSPPARAMYAYIQAINGDLRWRDDGTDPTASIGHKLAADEDHWYPVVPLQKIKFIRDTDEVATTDLAVTYYRPKDAN